MTHEIWDFINKNTKDSKIEILTIDTEWVNATNINTWQDKTSGVHYKDIKNAIDILPDGTHNGGTGTITTVNGLITAVS